MTLECYLGFQTAERIREVHPEEPWFHLTGLIHDLGKVMAMWGEPQWSTVGDTFLVGCSFSDQCVFGKDSFEFNADTKKDEYNTRLGVYSENCGLSNIMMSWGHDEYMYRVLKNHPTCTLPEEAFYMIRFHSFYPWHTQEDYMYLCDNKDTEMLKWVLDKFDLYSKGDSLPDTAALTPYYQSLVDEFLPGDIKF
ncbi:hypothetical protein CAPTEDRAFT_100789 [Capitella teleta]|uniref:Inositol oxygenase n=1 Tax=Capitella teleta TaxID=283909 RepID=R7VF09_CAPTE|nr:hypothetical protein CAPTEDRAFT_100789 [Capitella teleta]|eukprot:ELU14250.1 hypothetical protein CAPTEDRAFT_100789 [Capitella teleta]